MRKFIDRLVFIGRQIIRLTIFNLLNTVLLLIPIEKKTILFGGWGGKKYLDNTKHLFIYFNKQSDGFKKIWITKDKGLTAFINAQGYSAYYAYSIIGMIKQIRASAIIFCQSVEEDFLSYLIKPYIQRIQLWHGTPIKKIGYSDKFNISSKGVIQIVNLIIPFYTDRLDLCIAIGEYDKKIYEGAFNISPENVVITGYPRNDILMLKKNVDVEHILARKILYLPTHRVDFSYLQSCLLNEVLSDHVQKALKSMNCKLYVKLHPAQTLNKDLSIIFDGKDDFNFIYQDQFKDIYDEIFEYDIFITDVSGFFFDIILTERKIYNYFPDLQKYLETERDLYYDINEISISKVYSNFTDLINDIAKGHYDDGRHNSIRNKFHAFQDGKSSDRVYDEIIKRLR